MPIKIRIWKGLRFLLAAGTMVAALTVPVHAQPAVRYDPSRITPQTVLAVKKAVNAYPSQLMDTVEAYGFDITIFSKNLSDMYGKPGGDILGITFETDKGNRHIYISQTAPDVYHVTLHELAHAIDWSLGYQSNLPRIKKAWDNNRSKGIQLLSASEFYAEYLSFYIDNRDVLSKVSPEMLLYDEALFERFSDTEEELLQKGTVSGNHFIVTPPYPEGLAEPADTDIGNPTGADEIPGSGVYGEPSYPQNEPATGFVSNDGRSSDEIHPNVVQINNNRNNRMNDLYGKEKAL